MIGPGSCHSYMQVLRRRPPLAGVDVRREHAEALLAHLPDDHLFWERDDGRVGGRQEPDRRAARVPGQPGHSSGHFASPAAGKLFVSMS